MMKNLFQLYSFVPSTNENNFGAKIIQFSDHKHKSENKKSKDLSSRAQSDSLARNLKNHQALRVHHHSSYKPSVRAKKSLKSKFVLKLMIFYAFAFSGILFGLFILFGGLTLFFK